MMMCGQLFVLGICEDDGDDQCADYGSNDHCKRVFDNMRFEMCFERKTGKVKWVRWGSHHWGLKEFLACRHSNCTCRYYS